MTASCGLRILLITAVTVTLSCGQARTNSNNDIGSASSSQSTATATPIAKQISPTDLQKLKWIEGTWRGTGDVEKPFYERYHFENDSTLVMEELADETASQVTKVTRYELKNGRFGNDRAVATALDDKAITFSPLIKDRNSFRWQSESKDIWKAILTLPASGTRPAKETIYVMERLK